VSDELRRIEQEARVASAARLARAGRLAEDAELAAVRERADAHPSTGAVGGSDAGRGTGTPSRWVPTWRDPGYFPGPPIRTHHFD
jgi:hypothetical protein